MATSQKEAGLKMFVFHASNPRLGKPSSPTVKKITFF